MKRIVQLILVWVSIIALSGCNVHFHKSPEDTSSGRAAYGDHATDFRAYKKKSQKTKQQSRREAKRDRPKDQELYGSRRPY